MVNGCRLNYFSAKEFQRQAVAGGEVVDWANSMDRRLLVLLDALRSVWAKPIVISAAPGAIGRYEGTSRHSIEAWGGTVMAVDVMPEGIASRAEAEKFYYQAKQLGFGGIGFYPNWNPQPGFHLDTRQCEPYKPQCWGSIDGKKYISLHETFNSMRC